LSSDFLRARNRRQTRRNSGNGLDRDAR
jgi:hypothetical protein